MSILIINVENTSNDGIATEDVNGMSAFIIHR